MTAHSDLESTVSSYQTGAFDYVAKPFDVDDVVNLTQRAAQIHRQKQPAKAANEIALEDEESSADVPEIIGKAQSMQEVFRAIGRLSRVNHTVLINGETGTGKELVASALHKHSPRAAQPFIALNMAAIPHDLMESELFGHERGSFTGAQTQRQGRFEQADGGTLFLDEIGDMPAELQTRLLRVLAEGKFYRVGGHSPIQIDVRIIAATHQNLEERVKSGKFREDLFHRLNVIRINIPPIRERREDIPALLDFFLDRSAKELSEEKKTIAKPALDYLSKLDWTGNVRQIENVCRWMSVMVPGQEVQIPDLPHDLLTDKNNEELQPASNNWEYSLKRWAQQFLMDKRGELLTEAMPRFEKILTEVALQHTSGKRQEAALLLGWGRNTLTRKIKELEIE